MRCPQCGRSDDHVFNSRSYPGYIRRRRKCLNADCRYRWTTYERIEDDIEDAIVNALPAPPFRAHDHHS